MSDEQNLLILREILTKINHEISSGMIKIFQDEVIQKPTTSAIELLKNWVVTNRENESLLQSANSFNRSFKIQKTYLFGINFYEIFFGEEEKMSKLFELGI